MGTHAGFIVAAYAVTGLVLAGMLLAILLDYRTQARALARLTEQIGRGGQSPATRTPAKEGDHEP